MYNDNLIGPILAEGGLLSSLTKMLFGKEAVKINFTAS